MLPVTVHQTKREKKLKLALYGRTQNLVHYKHILPMWTIYPEQRPTLRASEIVPQ